MSHDPNDLPADSTTTGRLVLNTEFVGDFDPHPFFQEYETDVDWYKVNLSSGRSYLVELAMIAYVDMHLEADFISSPNEGRIEFTTFGQQVFSTFRSGDFFVSAGHAFGIPDGPYRIEVSDYEVPESTATKIVLETGRPNFNLAEFEFDRDYFRIELTEGWTYQFDLQGQDSGGGTLTDPFLRLYDNTQTLLLSDNDSGQGRNARIAFVAPATGSFYLSAAGLTTSIGSYRLDSTLIDYLDDAATGPGTSARLDWVPNHAGFFEGRFEIEGDIDWFKVDLVAGRWYKFGIVGEDEPLVFIRDPDNNVLNAATGNDAYFYIQAQQTGVHHIVTRNGSNDYTVYGIDNTAPVITPFAGHVNLVANQTMGLDQLFSLNSFPAARIQIVSEADFLVGTTKLDRYLLHTLDVSQMSAVRFDATLQRGTYDVSLRALGGGTVSGWAETVVTSEPGSYQFLNIDRFWNASNTQRQSESIVTYRFADSVPSYFSESRFSGFAEVSPFIKSTFRSLLKSTSGLTGLGITFIEDSSESADMQIFTADADQLAVGYWPGTAGLGDIVLDNTFYAGNATAEKGSLEYFSILKAFGAAMGIKHFAPEFDREQSVMGLLPVDDSHPYPETMGYWDSSYLKSRYGSAVAFDPSANLGQEDREFVRTLTDGGFFLTISASNADRPAVIDLREGATSYLLGDGPYQSYILGKNNPYERAFGSDFDDSLTGSYGDNRILAGTGNDILNGLGGNDDLSGGLGDDTYMYQTGDGNDLLAEHTSTSQPGGGTDTLRLTGKFGMSSLDDDLTFRKMGNDLVINLDMNGQINRSSGRITIKDMGDSVSQIEKLDLRNFQMDIGVYSLVSIWQAANDLNQRFAPDGGSDAFGLTATPL